MALSRPITENLSDEQLDRCQAALALLRQEVELTASDTTSKIAKACRRTYPYALAAFKEQYGKDNLSALAEMAFVAFLAREMCIPVTGRQEDLKALDALYAERLQAALLHDLKTELRREVVNGTANPASLEQEVLSRLLAEFKGGAGAPDFNVAAFKTRIGDVAHSVLEELKVTLGLGNVWWDGEGENEQPMDWLAKGALIAGICAALAGPVGVPAERITGYRQEYAAKVAEWRKVQLNKALASNVDPVLAELVANFKSDDAGLVNAFTVYEARKNAVQAESENEVCATLGLASDAALDGLAQACANILSVAKLATACGLGADVKQLKMQEYAAKIAEWRKVQLNEALAGNGDPVLAELVANFKSDDAGLLNAFTVYTARKAAVKKECENEVCATLGITVDPRVDGELPETTTTSLNNLGRAAINCLMVARLATACGLDANMKQLKMQEYAAKIAEWRKVKLNLKLKDNLTGTGPDPVLAELVANFKSDDAGLLNAFDVYTGRSKVVKETCAREIAAAHGWAVAFAGTVANGATTYPTGHVAYPAFVALCVAKLANACGLGEKAELLHQAYEVRLHRARVKALSDGVAALSDGLQKEVLARLLGEFAEDDKAMGFNVDAYTRRIDAVKATVLGAINGAHDWSMEFMEGDMPTAIAEVWTLGVCAALGTTVGVPAERARFYREAYEAKLLEARVRDLHDKLAANADPVLAELVANFKADGVALVHLFDLYTSRVETARQAAREEVDAAHDWPALADATEAGRLDALRKAAVAARTLEALSVAAGGGEESARRYAQEYRAKLREARVYALAHEARPTGIVGEALDLLNPSFDAGDAALPFSLAQVAGRIESLLEPSRREVMDAHRWNFARVSLPLRANPGPDGRCMAPRPHDAVRVEAVKDPDGGLCDWSMRGAWIVSDRPVGSVTYIRDVEDVDEWPPDVRRALAYRLAAVAASSVPAHGKDPSVLMDSYARLLSEAQVRNAREGNPGRAAWGRGGEFKAAFRNGGFGGGGFGCGPYAGGRRHG